ncbi:MAG: hypothetical protein IPM60_04145 [Rhodospirillales bacterium]|nr:hypothetical protein [Rhodospirillales bacterium]
MTNLNNDNAAKLDFRAGWRACCSVLLIGHGSTRRSEAFAVLERHAQTLQQRRGFKDVRAAALFGDGGLEQSLVGLGDPVFIVPMFMANGYTVRTALPAALRGAGFPSAAAGRKVYECEPVGLSTGIADLIVAKGLAAAPGLALAPSELALILCAHGSDREPASAEAADLQVARVVATGCFRSVRAAYLEQRPVIGDSLRESKPPVAVVGLFSGGSQHATRDVEEAIADAPQARALNLGAIGADDGMAAVIEAALVHLYAAGVR